MNVESYTVIFLKKQKYLNLPGIGNFRLVKNNGQEEINFSPVSIIDDMFASFIGVNENVSSNNAANAISNYAKEVKNSLKAGQKVNIPGLGTLKSENNVISFTQEPEDTFLKPTEDKHFRDLKFGQGTIPTNKPTVVDEESPEQTTESKTPEENITFKTQTYNPAYDEDTLREESEKKEKQKKLTRSLLTAVLILAILGILIWAFYSFLSGGKSTETPATPETQEEIETTSPVTTDSLASDSYYTSTPADNSANWQIVTKSYDSEISADKRQKQLSEYGWNVNKEAGNDGEYNIVVTIANDGRNVDDVVDSVRKVLNPSGKAYLKK